MKEVYFDKEIKTVIATYTGVPNLKEFKKIANAQFDLLVKHNAYKTFNDILKLEVNSIENQEWTQNVWFPKAEKAGLKYFAFRVSENIFGIVSAEQTNEKAEQKGIIEIKYFKEKKDALKWLSEK